MTRKRFKSIYPYWIACAVLGLIIGLGGGALVSSRAFGAAVGICSPTDPEQMCWTPRHANKKFHEGYYKKAHGLHGVTFRHPAKTRRLIVKRIAAKIAHASPRELARIEQHFSNRSGVCQVGSNAGRDICLARLMYGELVNKARCVGYTPSSSPNSCVVATNTDITYKGVLRGGTLFLCGAGVVFAVVTAPETAGASTVAMGAFLASTTCAFGYLASVVN